MKTYRSVATSLLAAAMAALVSSGPASGQPHEFPIQGGEGGSFFRVFCPPGNFMVGLRGRAGAVIDNLQLRCAGFGTLASIPPRKNWTRDPNTFEIGNAGSSPGGSSLLHECPVPNFVRGVEFNTERFLGRHLIAFVTMTCEHGTFSGFQELKFGFNFPPGFPSTQKQFCPDGMWAVGLKGRQGERVDALALLCAQMPPL
jgi:hypothetical protein